LARFEQQVHPERGLSLRRGLLSMLLGTVAVYAALFATGHAIYGHASAAAGLTVLAVVCGWALFKVQTRSTP
jgi:hypothetical protein